MIEVCADPEALAQAAAQIFIEQSKLAIVRCGRFNVVLSGGNTPARTYSLLASNAFRNQVNWARVNVFWGDERCVPPSDSRSNFGTADRTFLSHVCIPREQIHPILCDQQPSASAAAYEAHLKQFFGASLPCFDFVFLGLGEDGHTASLFPHSLAVAETERWVIDVQRPEAPQAPRENFARITLSTHLLNQARMVVFLVSGGSKAKVLKEVLAVEPAPTLPATLIQPIDGKLLWLVDKAATSSENLSLLRQSAC